MTVVEKLKSNKCRIISSDSLHVLAIVIMVITLALGATKPKSAFSWTKFTSPTTPDVGSADWEVGLLDWTVCAAAPLGCTSGSPSDVLKVGSGEAGSKCLAAGQGVIAAATFAMLFGLLSVLLLHYIVSFKERFRIPFPRIVITITSFLSLCLYIVVVATWYEKCHNLFSSGDYTFCYGACPTDGSTGYGQPGSLAPGYCVATAIVCVVLSFLAWGVAFWRMCRPGKDEPTSPKASAATSGSGYASQASSSDLGVTSPSAAGGSYKAASSPAASAPSSGRGYGGSYGNGNAYSNNDDEAEGSAPSGGGYSSGGYGGGGSYGNSAYGGSSYGNTKKQESAYGY